MRHTTEHLLSGRESHEENFLGKWGHSKAPPCAGEFRNQAHTQYRMHAQKIPKKTLSLWCVGSVHACVLSHLNSVTPWTLACQEVRRTSQARILEWVAIYSTGGSSRPRDRIWVSCGCCSAGRLFTPAPPRSVQRWLNAEGASIQLKLRRDCCLLLVFKEISVKTIVEHKLKEQRLQWPNMTRNTVFAKIIWN